MKFLGSLLALGVFCVSSAVAEEKVVGGPYVVNATARQATIGWIVQTDDVKYGASPDNLSERSPALVSRKTTVTGLKAGSVVHYEAFPGGKGQFKTALAAGGNEYKFVVFGDTRTRHDVHKRIVDAITHVEPDFVLHTGDLVSDGYDTAQWLKFFDIERPLLRNTVYFPVLGNHERNNRQFHDFFEIRSPYYSFLWGNAKFILLNTDIANVSPEKNVREDFWKNQVAWLEEELAKGQSAKYRFIVTHHPPYSAYEQSASHRSKEALSLVPLLEKYKVTAIFSGHDHTYQHHLQNGVRYIISGGGGAPLNNVDAPIAITRKVARAEHFVEVKVSGETAKLRAVAIDGSVIDEFSFE